MQDDRRVDHRVTLGGFAAVLLAATLGSGCGAKAAPLLPTGLPPLDAPDPPPRLVVPAPEPIALPPDAPVPQPPAPETPPKPAGDRNTPPVTRPPATRPPTDPPVTQDPPPVLRTPADTAEYERHVRAQLVLARSDLARVSRPALGPEARAQYDSAAGFIRQAEQALTVKNLVYAGQLADKAATMAALLRR